MALPQPDPDVLRLARHGDERAFALIVRQYQMPLFNYITRVLSGDRALAEDMCQEVFLRVYQALPGFRLRAASSRPGCSRWPSTGWWTSCGRASGAAGRRSSSTWSRTCTRSRIETDAIEEMDAVWRAIGALPLDLKMALLLRDVVGLSYAEIAESLDTTLATVKWRIYKARETVAAELQLQGYGRAAPRGGKRTA